MKVFVLMSSVDRELNIEGIFATHEEAYKAMITEYMETLKNGAGTEDSDSTPNSAWINANCLCDWQISELQLGREIAASL